jgi:glycosyltransferase involved in cell wall biosynthesis
VNKHIKILEHVIVDAGSTDDTFTIIKKHKIKKKIIIKKKSTIYEGINLGIKNSTGNYILILNSDDILYNKNTVKNIVNEIKKSKKKFY